MHIPPHSLHTLTSLLVTPAENALRGNSPDERSGAVHSSIYVRCCCARGVEAWLLPLPPSPILAF